MSNASESRGVATHTRGSADTRGSTAAGVTAVGLIDSARQRVLALAVGITVAAVYLATSARYVLGGDNGEFAVLSAQGGVAHPTGYPLYTIYLRALSWLPGESAAHTAALSTALIGVALFATLRWAAKAWGASPPAATTAATLIAVSPLVWTMSTHAEVFALHGLLTAAIVGVCGPMAQFSHARRVGILAALAGCGLANNHSIVTLAPLGLFVVIQCVLTAERRLPVLAAGVGGLVLGLSPYLYTFVVGRSGNAAMAWGDTGTLAGLWHHVTRADYGTLQLAIADGDTSRVAHVVRLLTHLATELYVVPVVLVLVGFAVMLVKVEAPRPQTPTTSESSEAIPLPLHRRTVRESKPQSVRQRISLRAPIIPNVLGWVYLVTLCVAGPLFVSRFNLPLDGLALLIVERFYLLPLVLLAVPLALGIDRLFGRIIAPVDVLGPVLVSLICLGVFVSYDTVRDHHRPDVEYYLSNSLWTAEPNAVILGTGDHRLYGFGYVQQVEGVRPDVVFVDPVMLNYPWYVAQIEERLGFALQGITDGAVDTRYLAASVLNERRPLYITNRFSAALTDTFPTYPIGTLIRVLPQTHRPPPPDTLEEMNVTEALQYRYPESDAADPNGWAAYVQQEYVRPWQVLADAYTAAGRPADAERCRTRRIVLPGGFQ